MNDFLRNFIMTGIRDMIKRDIALYQTYQYASGWFSKGVLIQEDLEEIDKLYKDKEVLIEETEEEINTETEPENTVEETTKVTEVEEGEE